MGSRRMGIWAAALAVMALLGPGALRAAADRKAFEKAVLEAQASPSDQGLRRKVLKMAAEMKSLPDAPEEVLVLKGKAAYIVKNANSVEDFKPAVDAYEKATALAPWEGNLYYNLGVVQEKAGMPNEAAASFKLYLLGVPDAEDRDKVLARLGKLEVEKEKVEKQEQRAAVNEELDARNAKARKKWESQQSAATVVAVLGGIALAGGAVELGLGYGNQSDSKYTTTPGYAGGVLYNISYQGKYWSSASYASYTDGEKQVSTGWTLMAVGGVVLLIGVVMSPPAFHPEQAMLEYQNGRLAFAIPAVQMTPGLDGMQARLLHSEF